LLDLNGGGAAAAAWKNDTLTMKHQVYTGCLQLLEIYWNLKTLLEISLNLYGPTGNFCVKCE